MINEIIYWRDPKDPMIGEIESMIKQTGIKYTTVPINNGMNLWLKNQGKTPLQFYGTKEIINALEKILNKSF